MKNGILAKKSKFFVYHIMVFFGRKKSILLGSFSAFYMMFRKIKIYPREEHIATFLKIPWHWKLFLRFCLSNDW